MLSVREATAVAAESFDEFYQDEPFEDIRLEEVERVEEEGNPFWLITLGYVDKSGSTDRGAMNIVLPRSIRSYKQFKIDADMGDVVWMKIRSVENA